MAKFLWSAMVCDPASVSLGAGLKRIIEDIDAIFVSRVRDRRLTVHGSIVGEDITDATGGNIRCRTAQMRVRLVHGCHASRDGLVDGQYPNSVGTRMMSRSLKILFLDNGRERAQRNNKRTLSFGAFSHDTAAILGCVSASQSVSHHALTRT